jgi:hypothetical protein
MEAASTPTKPTSSRTIAGHFVRDMLVGAERRGENIAWFLDQVGISPAILEQPRARVRFGQVTRLLCDPICTVPAVLVRIRVR